MRHVAGLRLSVWLWLPAFALALMPGQGRADNCADLRGNIVEMDAQSNALPGYLGMRVQLASVYNRLCGSSPVQRTENWYTIDGKQLGPVGSGDRPANAAYAATDEIGKRCAGTTNPSMCALALGAFANCKAPAPDIKEACSVPGGYGDPADTVAATGGDPLPDARLIIGGKTYDVPNACAQALAQAGDGGRTTQVVRSCPDDLLAALGQAEGKDANVDPTGFLSGLGPLLQRGFNPPGASPKGGFDAAFCAQMQHNADVCKQRENNMGPVGQQVTGTTGQTGAFDDCSRLYGRFAGMCRMNVNQRPQIAKASLPRSAAPPPAAAAPKPTTATSAPPPAPAKPACPAGTTANEDGYCLGAGQKYCGGGMTCSDGMRCGKAGHCITANGCDSGYVNINHFCIPAGDVPCDGGRYSCPAGESCNGHGGCHGGNYSGGPMCANGNRTRAGWVCLPSGTSYDPSRFKMCGSTLCSIADDCGDNECLGSVHQTAVPRQGAGRAR
jgi:hypothetical protein